MFVDLLKNAIIFQGRENEKRKALTLGWDFDFDSNCEAEMVTTAL